jgi:hypothetical protein
MKEVKLYTEKGDYVVTAIVPDFEIPYNVFMWGTRVFVWNNEHEKYMEQSALAVVQHKFESQGCENC